MLMRFFLEHLWQKNIKKKVRKHIKITVRFMIKVFTFSMFFCLVNHFLVCLSPNFTTLHHPLLIIMKDLNLNLRKMVEAPILARFDCANCESLDRHLSFFRIDLKKDNGSVDASTNKTSALLLLLRSSSWLMIVWQYKKSIRNLIKIMFSYYFDR